MKWSLASLASVLLMLAGCSGVREGELSNQDWKQYKTMFVASGAVRDSGNQNVSHSEGQGYGMLLAESYGDREVFDQMWDWAQQHLQVRDDKLFAWRWHPVKGVDDPNNASDGDVLIAWALLRAADRWDDPEYREAAQAILSDVKRLLVTPINGYQVLLPGHYGFAKDNGFELNLAYWVFPAFERFVQEDPQGPWQELIQSGEYLIDQAAYGSYQLPSDWLLWEFDLSPAPAVNRPARFGYEVIRVPLYLAWGNIESSLLTNFDKYWTSFSSGSVPAWIDVTQISKADYSAPAGFKAIHDLVGKTLLAGQSSAASKNNLSLSFSKPIANQDYYSASLSLLAQLALNERFNP